jgi:hypothetical protein
MCCYVETVRFRLKEKVDAPRTELKDSSLVSPARDGGTLVRDLHLISSCI